MSVPRVKSLASLAFGQAIAVLTILAVFTPGPVQAETALADSVPHISVIGRAYEDYVPDLAIISVAAQTERPKAADAAAETTRIAQALVADIRAAGVEQRDIRTTSVTISPVYNEERDPQGRVLRRILRGYLARNGLEIRVRDMTKAGPLARSLVDKGANVFGGIAFRLNDTRPAELDLKGRAAADALERARTMLAPLGARLGRVLSVEEPGADGNNRMQAAAAPMAKRERSEDLEQAAIPLEPGVIRLFQQITVTWQIDPVP